MEQRDISSLDIDSLKTLIQNLNDLIINSGFPNINFSLRNQTHFDSDTPRKIMRFVFEGTVSNIYAEKSKKLKEDISKLFGVNAEEAFIYRVKTTYSLGEKFPTVDNLVSYPSKETKSFVPPTGEVVLIDFWATWCGPCQKPMAHNQEMLEKNHEKWAGKARIVGISLDDDYSDIEERVTSKKWEKIEHYQSAGGWESNVANMFGIDGIPCVMLLDKNGLIRYSGHPSEIELEDKINELIAEADGAYKPEDKKSEDNNEGNESKDEVVKLSLEEEFEAIKKFTENVEANKSLLEGQDSFDLGVVSQRTFLPKPSVNPEFYLEGQTDEQGKEKFIEIYKKCIKTLPSVFKGTPEMVVPKKFSVNFGTSCATCHKELNKSVPHYVCTKCQEEGIADHAFCADCANQEMSQDIQSASQLFHPHGLVYLHEKCESNLDNMVRQYNGCKLILDSDPEFADLKQSKNIGGFYCDDCGAKITHYRWGCSHCPDFDYCNNCFQVSINDNHEKYKAQQEKVEPKGHKDTHIFYRQHFLEWLERTPPAPIDFLKEAKDE